MAPLKALQWAALMLPNLLAQLPCGGASAAGSQVVLQQQQPHEGPGSEQTPLATSQRRLRGKFLHITDLHPDEHYKPHTSTRENLACHRGKGPAGVYGAETSDCDAPLTLVDATLAWVREHLRDEIDFVVWTGDSARHDSDETLPRHNKDILAMNRRIADSFVDTFSDDDGRGLVVPVVPTFGNNDIYPHNILLPGPNDILRTYGGIWARFIPEAQRHSFEFGGWFYVEVIPGRLAVFSLNTMYFFDRNAGIDDCVHPAEPGYGHFEWLLVQLDALRARGMKAILMGHVPPARTAGKQLWEETCWQKYTLWLQRYRDVVVGSLYGHMNIDHFLLQDTDDIDMALIRAATTSSSTSADDEQASTTRETMGEDDFSIQSGASYLKELRDDWANLPSPVALEQGVDEGIESGRGKKGKGKGKGKFGGRWAERYQLTLISPSVVPNYFPGLRVFEYNITGLEETPTWMDPARTKEGQQLAEDVSEVHELKKRQDSDLEAEKKKKRKGKGKKPPADPGLRLPEPPPRGTPPGPAYRPQALTLLGFTQYYANLTHINNDLAGDASSSPSPSSSSSSSSSWLPSSWLPSGWNPGKHEGRRPARPEPRPRTFGFEVEYSTFDDRVYGLADLTVKSFVRLAHRIGQASEKSDSAAEHYDDDDDDDATTATTTTDNYGEDETYDNDLNESPESRRSSVKKDKKKGNKGKGKGKESHKTWLHFLKHAFVSTKNKEELEDL